MKLPYWLEPGTETCADCTHMYHYEVVRRCSGCDRGVCEHCVVVVRETREVLCPQCAREAED
ncbi:MAG TPA: hypothetical protein VK928_10770 [Longimicrobiales bacterium]|nr:hypothetical protein [Longimicrobiales bacterium]